MILMFERTEIPIAIESHAPGATKLNGAFCL
jgi:hypothetical protein